MAAAFRNHSWMEISHLTDGPPGIAAAYSDGGQLDSATAAQGSKLQG